MSHVALEYAPPERSIYLLQFQVQTLAAPVRELFPECQLFIKDSPQLNIFSCFLIDCHVGRGCMDKLVRRVAAVFDYFPGALRLILYFRHRDARPGQRPSIGAALFKRDMSEPALIGKRFGHKVCWSGLRVMERKSIVVAWHPSRELFLPHPADVTEHTIIPVSEIEVAALRKKKRHE
jgi:hypothetical protein